MSKQRTVTARVHICPTCGKEYQLKSGLNRHMKKSHGTKAPRTTTRIQRTKSVTPSSTFRMKEDKRTGEKRPIPISGQGARQKPVRVVKKHVKHVSKDLYVGGRKAKMYIEVGGVTFATDIRWETEKVDPLVKTEYQTPAGKLVQMKYMGPKKRQAWIDEDSREWNKSDVQLMQIHPDGKRTPIDPFTMTKEIEAEERPKDLMDEFMPHSYVEIWGDNTESQKTLRDLAYKLRMEGKVAAVRQFVKSKGRKAYVGFIRPVIAEDGDFTLEMMVSENRRRRRRWMPAEDAIVGDDVPKKESGAKVPEVF